MLHAFVYGNWSLYFILLSHRIRPESMLDQKHVALHGLGQLYLLVLLACFLSCSYFYSLCPVLFNCQSYFEFSKDNLLWYPPCANSFGNWMSTISPLRSDQKLPDQKIATPLLSPPAPSSISDFHFGALRPLLSLRDFPCVFGICPFSFIQTNLGLF